MRLGLHVWQDMPNLVGLGSMYVSENVGATVDVQLDPVVTSLVTAKKNNATSQKNRLTILAS